MKEKQFKKRSAILSLGLAARGRGTCAGLYLSNLVRPVRGLSCHNAGGFFQLVVRSEERRVGKECGS